MAGPTKAMGAAVMHNGTLRVWKRCGVHLSKNAFLQNAGAGEHVAVAVQGAVQKCGVHF
jgi:hypothetical protein